MPASDRAELNASLARIAEPLRTQFAEALASSRDGLRALKHESRRKVREAADRVRSDDLRHEAREAFEAGDYARAAMLYESAGGDLRLAERKRLDIAGHRSDRG